MQHKVLEMMKNILYTLLTVIVSAQCAFAQDDELQLATVDSLEYMASTYLSVDADCKTTDENPTFTDEEYIERLSSMPTIIEMPYNEVVRKFIDRYTGDLRLSVSYMLGGLNFYVPIFEEALEAYGLPLELKYLPIIESALNPNAVSKAGAAGLWQFMLTAGKSYGLTVNSLVDERRDPVKSSWAAAHLLSDLYKKFDDWTLAIAAYNCGEENVRKAITRAKGERDYWQIYPYLPQETRGYVPAFIAANYVMTYYCEHGICPMTATLPQKTDTVMVSRNVHMEQIASVLELDIEQIRALNPAYRKDVIPGATALSTLRLPEDKVLEYIQREDDIVEYRAKELLTKRSVTAVKVEEPVKNTSKKKTAATTSGTQYITVKSGMTLGGIAKTYGTTVKKLQQLNGLKGTNIRAGQKLRVR